MCVAIYKPAGLDVPTGDTLYQCWVSNDDGAGYAWYNPASHTWIITKGLLTWIDFIRSFDKHAKDKDFKNKQVMIHFRIGTSGSSKGAGHTHPFPICSDEEELMKT